MPLNDHRKAVQTVYTEEAVAQHLKTKISAGMSLRQVAAEYGNPITHADIERALEGRFPKGLAKRRALHVPDVCVSCGQRVKVVRHTPAWLKEAVKNLAALEAAANHPLAEPRVYARGGRRVR